MMTPVPAISPLDRLAPSSRLLGLVCVAVPGALVQTLFGGAAVLLLGCLLAACARLPVLPLLRRLAVVNGFVAFLWLLLPLTYPGETLFTLGPLHFSRTGAFMAGLITLKSNGLVLAFTGLAAAMPMHELGRGLHALRTPSAFIQLLLFTARYVHVFGDELRRLRQAARARGFAPRTNAHTYRTYGYMAGMLLARSHDRAKRVYWAMLCRGFTGVFPAPEGARWRGRDALFSAAALCLAAALAVMDAMLLSSRP